MQFVHNLTKCRLMSEHQIGNLISRCTIDDPYFQDEFESPRDNIAYLKAFKAHKSSDTLPILAARDFNLNLLKILWRFGFDFEAVNSDGKNALHEVYFKM